MPGGDFSVLLFLLAAPQNTIPAMAPMQSSEQALVNSVPSAEFSFTAPLPASLSPPIGADLGETDQVGPPMTTIDLSDGSAAVPIAGVQAPVLGEISRVRQSLPNQTRNGALSRSHGADQGSADRQMIGLGNGETSEPLEAGAIATPAGSLPRNDELKARAPVLTVMDEEKLKPAIAEAVVMPDGQRTLTQSITKTDLPIQTARTAESIGENLQTLPEHQRLPQGAPAATSTSTRAKKPGPDTGAAASWILTSAPAGVQPAMKPDLLETHVTDSDAGMTLPHSAPMALSHPSVTVQQKAANEHQGLPDSAFDVNTKPDESSRKDSREISSTASNLVAARMLNPELHGVYAPQSIAAPASVLHQVVKELATNIQSKRHEALMTLDPPELGNLKISLSVDGDQVQVHILAETRESRELLEKHLPELKQALQIQQLNIVNVRVESGRLSEFTGDPRQGFQQPSGEGQGWQGNWTDSSGAETTPADARQMIPARGEDGRVSMWA